MIPKFLNNSGLVHKPGVYIFKDKTGKVLYVGKAIDLRHRVSSYFQRSHGMEPKQKILVGQIADVQTITVQSELEALILEANLIKKYQPAFNIRLTDDKDYLYIVLTREDFPKVITARKKDLLNTNEYWGPFPSSRTVRDTLKSLRKVFPWCGSNIKYNNRRTCFYYHLGQCPGACLGAVDKKEYQKIISRFSKFMDGKKDELVSDLTREMMRESRATRFEEAAKIKKIIEGIEYLTQPNRVSFYLENPNFLTEENQLALQQLKKDLRLKKLPERIEGYDISNIQGKEAVGSMVVLTGGEIDKSQYRKFKIIVSGKPNDVGMMREMLRRRLKHHEWSLPDLIIVDGGRGQARVAQLEVGKLKIPVYGLAKHMEWLYPSDGPVLKLSRKSLSLKLLQKLRDEAHRFAVSYHRKLLRKSVFAGT